MQDKTRQEIDSTATRRTSTATQQACRRQAALHSMLSMSLASCLWHPRQLASGPSAVPGAKQLKQNGAITLSSQASCARSLSEPACSPNKQLCRCH